MKPIDFDGIFDKKFLEYYRENADKYTSKQWEDKVPLLYKKFADTYFDEISSTPREYYAKMSDDEIVEELRAHFQTGVPVSDLLCREIEQRNCPNALLSLIEETEDKENLMLCINLAGAREAAHDVFFRLLQSGFDGDVKDAVTDQLKENADAVKERALQCYAAGVERDLMLEILSRVKKRDDRVYDVLMRAFSESDDLSAYAGYLANYGDPRALEVFLERIADETLNYIEFRELKFAIEALGGEYNTPRDFSDDPYYREISQASEYPVDFFESRKKDV